MKTEQFSKSSTNYFHSRLLAALSAFQPQLQATSQQSAVEQASKLQCGTYFENGGSHLLRSCNTHVPDHTAS